MNDMGKFRPEPPRILEVRDRLAESYFPVNGHIESDYSIENGEWTPPKFITDPYLRLHGLSPALNYGQQVYEGLKGT